MPNNLKALLYNGLRMLVYGFHGAGFLVWVGQTTFSRPAFEAPTVSAGVLYNVFVVAGPRLQVPEGKVAIPAQWHQIGGVQFSFRCNVHWYQVMGFELPIRTAREAVGALQGSVAKSTPPRGPGRPEYHPHGAGKQAVNHAGPAR